MHRIYEIDSGEPVGERYGSVHDPYLQIAGCGVFASFVMILLLDKVLPYLGVCEPVPAGNMIPVITGILGMLWGYYGVSEPDQGDE